MKEKRSIRSKIMFLSLALLIGMAAIISLTLFIQRFTLRSTILEEINSITKNEVTKIATDVYLMVRMADESVRQQLESNLKVAKSVLDQAGRVSFSDERVTWKAVDQITKAEREVSLPKMMVGDTWLGQNRDAHVRTPVVDRTKELVGGAVTIFQRMDQNGNMLRVATNVTKADGTRAIGTYIAAAGADGKPNPVIEAILAGRPYRGRAFVVDAWYVADYEPIKNDAGAVVGMLFVGIKQENLDSLRQGIMDIVVGKTGYVFVLGAEGDERGKYIISAKGKRDGENIWEAKDSDGNFFIQEIIKKAEGTQDGSVDYVRYPWINKDLGETKARNKLAAVTYYKPWDWVIGAGMYEDDYYAVNKRVGKALTIMILIVVAFAGIAVGVGYVMTKKTAVKITAPLTTMVEVANELALGNIDQQVDVDSDDEVGDLAQAFQGMVAAQQEMAKTARAVALGDMSVDIQPRSPKDVLAISLRDMVDVLKKFSSEIGTVSKAVQQGKLDARANANDFAGGWAELATGVNGLVDAFVKPFKMAANYIDRIAKGDLPEKNTDVYQGDYNQIKNNLNQCIDSLHAMRDDVRAMCVAAVDGQLNKRADASKHQGAYGKIVQGLNEVFDALVKPLKMAASNVQALSDGKLPPKITEEYKGDYNEIKDNLNQLITTLEAMQADVQKLIAAGRDGRLSERADAAKHQGIYQAIVQGFNETLEAVTMPIGEAAKTLELLSNYDLKARMVGDYKGDHAKIKESLNATASVLHDALAQVADTVEQVSSAGAQIANSSQVVAQGASEQASSLEETSSSLEEMASMTKHNADNAQQANSLAQASNDAAANGAKAMSGMLDAMAKIRQASEGTAEIIKDINEIAFQTNLLALNAAVEAARAGDAGRGFAVVAEEVRSLAQRSKDAAKKTEDLIKESTKLAGEGEVISKDVNQSLSQIVEAVNKVTLIIKEIAVASQEQSKGIEQVNKAVAEMDKVTQQNAANSEESSSAAEELSSQAQELAALVGRFQLSRTTKVKAPTAQVATQRAAVNAKPVKKAPTTASRPRRLIPLDEDDEQDLKSF